MNFLSTQALTGISGRLDAHAHVFDTSLSMDTNRRYTPHSSALTDDYLKLLQKHKLNGGILVQPSFLGNDNSFLLTSLSQLNAIQDMSFCGVATLLPAASQQELNALAEGGIKGMRLNLFGMDRTHQFDVGLWMPLLKRIDALGWHVELHCQGEQLARVLPQLLSHSSKVVIDHFGLPDPNRPLSCSGQDAIIKSPHGRVFVKTSAPYRVFPGLKTLEAVRLCKPIFKQLHEALGAGQLLWGSDWPWTQFENDHCFGDTLSWLNDWQA